MKISDNYIIKNQRTLLRIYSHLSRESLELCNLGFDEISDRIVEGMDALEETLLSVGIEVYPEDHDEKLDKAWSWFCEMYQAIGKEMQGEKRIYKEPLRKYLKSIGWKSYEISNAFRDEPSRPIARLLDSGYIKAHGPLYWSLHHETRKGEEYED